MGEVSVGKELDWIESEVDFNSQVLNSRFGFNSIVGPYEFEFLNYIRDAIFKLLTLNCLVFLIFFVLNLIYST